MQFNINVDHDINVINNNESYNYIHPTLQSFCDMQVYKSIHRQLNERIVNANEEVHIVSTHSPAELVLRIINITYEHSLFFFRRPDQFFTHNIIKSLLSVFREQGV